jgi:hypothetical protein
MPPAFSFSGDHSVDGLSVMKWTVKRRCDQPLADYKAAALHQTAAANTVRACVPSLL